ncbi:MAG: esterase-like activity of phytase family protein [Sphingomonas phyllosphaerae]
MVYADRVRWPVTLAMVLLLVPPYSGDGRRPLFAPGLRITATPFVPQSGWPRRVGALEPIGALSLTANQPAFGGLSALALYRGQAILLSDGGLVVRLRIANGRLTTLGTAELADGPETGWRKSSRDTESLAVDPRSGRAWIGYERINMIWRYASDFNAADAASYPTLMRRWGINSGIESLVRLNDGRFVAFREGGIREDGVRAALLFDGDPALFDTPVARLRYRPPPHSSPSDAAVLPNGDVLVLNRRLHLPLRFEMTLVRIAADAIRPGATLHGQVVAQFGDTLGRENAEGLAVSRERGETMIWLVTDNDGAFWRRTILAKFRWRG